jgi:hypothetical protein
MDQQVKEYLLGIIEASKKLTKVVKDMNQELIALQAEVERLKKPKEGPWS